MYDPKLYELAYDKLKSKPGNMTPGVNPITLDGMSTEVIDDIIMKLKDGSFKFSPGRRVEIPFLFKTKELWNQQTSDYCSPQGQISTRGNENDPWTHFRTNFLR